MPNPIEFQQILPTKDTPESPTLSNRGSTSTFRPYDFPNTPTATNNQTVNVTNSITQKLEEQALHAQLEQKNQSSGCMVCGKSYKQVLEETTADYLQETAEPGRTVRERHLKRQADIARHQSGLIASTPRGVPQAATRDGIKYSINNGKATRKKFPPFCKTKVRYIHENILKNF